MIQEVILQLRVEMPAQMHVNDLREYVRDATSSWSGQFHPDHPLFGWFHKKKRLTIKPVHNGKRKPYLNGRFERNAPKHVSPDDIDNLYSSLSKARMSQAKLARKLGVSRTTLHLMFNHEIPMRNVYGIAIRAVIDD